MQVRYSGLQAGCVCSLGWMRRGVARRRGAWGRTAVQRRRHVHGMCMACACCGWGAAAVGTAQVGYTYYGCGATQAAMTEAAEEAAAADPEAGAAVARLDELWGLMRPEGEE